MFTAQGLHPIEVAVVQSAQVWLVSLIRIMMCVYVYPMVLIRL